MVMVRCNIMDVLQALSAFIKVTIMKLAGWTMFIAMPGGRGEV